MRQSRKRELLRCMAVWLLALSGVSGSAETRFFENHSLAPRVMLHLYNYAQVSSRRLLSAQDEAARILRQAGVEAVWIRHDPSAPASGSEPNADLPPTHLYIRIHSGEIPSSFGLPKDRIGFALRGPEGQSAVYASLFIEPIKRITQEQGFAETVILGHAIAHEVGHLLLGGQHTRNGLMSGLWSRKDLARTRHKNLLFTAKQAARMRADLLERAGAEEKGTKIAGLFAGLPGETIGPLAESLPRPE